MHQEFMKGKITIIGCPKLDDVDYSEKLTQIIANNNLANYDEVKKLTTGSSLAVTGALVESKGGSQKYEIVADKV